MKKINVEIQKTVARTHDNDSILDTILCMYRYRTVKITEKAPGEPNTTMSNITKVLGRKCIIGREILHVRCGGGGDYDDDGDDGGGVYLGGLCMCTVHILQI